MPIIKKDSYELVVTFAGECNASITVTGLTMPESSDLLHDINSDWQSGETRPCMYNPTRLPVMFRPTTIHALQVLQEVDYIPHPPESEG